MIDNETKRVRTTNRIVKTVFTAMLIGWIAAVSGSVSSAGDHTPQVPEGWSFTLPEGDAEKGEATFMKMRCFTCHISRAKVPDAPSVAAGVGPYLGAGYAKLPKEYLAESIIRAHKTVAAPGYEPSGDAAGMGQYNYLMTVEELLDLVAYLQSDRT